MEAYQGYFENGRFIPFDEVSIPERKRAIVTILDEPIEEETKAEKQRKAFETFIKEIKACDEEIPEHFERVNFTRELDL